ncbi:MAG TPA: hypothetical protein VFE23_21710 [Usitatibacter sp.]|nr:hypothetical protein [Usitatibacter sp.]
MRITTWNCRGGPFEKKALLLNSLHPDVAVIPEMPRPTGTEPNHLWFGDYARRGLGVIGSASYRLTSIEPEPDVPKHVMPVQVNGPIDFVLFAVWTMGQQEFSYVRAACVALDKYSPLIRSKQVVFAGDFNSNAIWDKDHPKDLNHSALVRRMSEHGLISAYHHARAVDHGKEADATYYHQTKAEQPFHIDYCFVPVAWADSISGVQIGTYADWREASDHRPLTVDVPLPKA